ncbi:site-specific DNA-methyltransferase [Acinetobacter rongchengensis]|uniref:site-specific DNA-methyltransferase (adenine-specific) n=1 Tax=Acinetobacter rongchengensis TaxID=2419601 RepID=A0A3A8F3L0_9GAMM|nr:site-specific DNA-methyltransferase [Acinetobacter rongchengensis]RKG37650.1 site-specific DNA-methyltransferase [Acinetobacter rongchengensis]
MTTENNTLDLPEENLQEGVFKFEPIKGYPMLNWKGKRPFTSTRYYPAQLKEQHGEAVNGWLNKIFWGDNLQVMSHLLREFRGKVDLIYIDPPFDSKADYKKKVSLRGAEAENDQSAFEEKQYTDIWANDEYLQFMRDRIILLRELLSPKGSIYLHCDNKASHLLRCILDEVFGSENFLNEIIWCYKERETSKRNFNHKHDTIFLYNKNKNSDYIFNYAEIVETYSPVTLKKFKYLDEDGRKYRLRGKDGTNDPKEENENTYRQYLDQQTGPLARDWFELAFVNQASDERLGYPTQKPEKLLEKFIKVSSNPNSIIFDCFMGSGTTQSVAMKLGRRFIGADINLGSIQTTTKRLIKVAEELKGIQLLEEEKEFYTGFEVYNVNHYDVFRNPVQAKELLIQALDIQPIPNSVYDGEKDGRMVKLMPVNHIATRADVADLIHGVDYKAFEKRKEEKPNQPVEKITIYCMGHEPDLAAFVQQSIGYKLDIEVVDILRDRSDLQFKRDSEALFKVENGQLVVDKFYPMNLLQKLSQTKDTVSDWREMVESIMIDWNYDGAVFQPTLTDIPAKNELVQGQYTIPEDAGTIRIKITDLLSESLERDLTEEELANG